MYFRLVSSLGEGAMVVQFMLTDYLDFNHYTLTISFTDTVRLLSQSLSQFPSLLSFVRMLSGMVDQMANQEDLIFLALTTTNQHQNA